MIKFFKYTFFLVFISLQLSPHLYAQKRTLDDLKSALILKLCDYITWPADTMPDYSIALLSNDPLLIKSMQNIAPQFTINDKRVNVMPIKDFDNITNYNVLFVDKGSNSKLAHINELIHGKGVLLFTENHTLTNEFMFNLLSDKKKGMVSFEFNRANLIFEGFDIHVDIIELKGSEIDVRDLYRQTKNRLENEENKVRSLSEQIEHQAKNIEKQNKEINKKNTIIHKQSNTIDQKELRLKEINSKLLSQEERMKEKQKVLNQLQYEVTKVNKNLNLQKSKLDNQFYVLDTLSQSIVKKQNTIDEKNQILKEKEGEITFRNRAIILLFALSGIGIFLLIIVYRTNKANILAKRTLALQKEELQATLDKLTQAQDQLIQSEKMASLGVLVAGIAHEINNPINFISSGILGLKKSISDIAFVLESYRKKYGDLPENKSIKDIENEYEIDYLLQANETMFTNINTGIERAVNIVTSLKTFSHENNEKEVVDIHKNIDLALTILHNQYKYKVEVKKEYGQVPEIECYPGKMNQVFVNLLNNAAQAIKEKGVIKIKTFHKDEFLFISIKDNGCGIQAKNINRVFDPFYTTKEVGKGTGMGLSIVYNIVQNHAGEIFINSEVDKYSEFIIKLPLRIIESE